MRKLGTSLSCAAVLLLTGQAHALVFDGPPEDTGSWKQRFYEHNVGTFDHIQILLTDGPPFEVPSGISNFDVSGWQQLYNDGTRIIAAGPEASVVYFDMFFSGDRVTDDFSFVFQAWDSDAVNPDLMKESAAVAWNGSWDIQVEAVPTMPAMTSVWQVNPGGSIQTAINNASSGDIVSVMDGTYSESLNIYKSLTLAGQSELGTIIDASGFSDYSMDASGDFDFIFHDFTLLGNPGFATAFGLKASGEDATIDIRRVTIQGCNRTALDLNGLAGGVIEDCSLTGTNYGVGLGMSDCSNIIIDGLTTSGNAWAGMALYAGAFYYTGGCDNVAIVPGSFSYAEPLALYIEEANGFSVSNFSVASSDFAALTGNNLNPTATAYVADVATAQAGVLSTDPVNGWVIDRSSDTYAVGAGMSIQAAIVAADPGDTIDVAAGTFEEQLHIDKDDLTIQGAGETQTTILSPTNLLLYYTTSADNYPIIFVDGCSGVELAQFKVDGAGRGDANYRFQGIAFWNADGSVEHVDIVDVRDTPFSGAQHGVGLYTYNDTGGPYTIDLDHVNVTGFQKGGIAFNGTGLTANATNCSTIGVGATDVTAQNGIQYYGGMGGTLTNCTVEGTIYTGEGWAASGVLLISGGTVNIHGGSVTDGDPAVYCQDTNANATELVIDNNDPDSGNGFYTRVQSGMTMLSESGLPHEAEPSAFGDAPLGGNPLLSTLAVSLTACDFTGQMITYGVATSNYVPADVIQLEMSNCWLRDWSYSIVSWASGGEVAFQANENWIVGGVGAYFVDGITTLQDLGENWWGTTDPDVLANDLFHGPIDYNPWLSSGTDAEPGTPGFQADYTELWVGPGGSIQEAIDAVSGSTVNLAPGVYNTSTDTFPLVIDLPMELLGPQADVDPRPFAGGRTGGEALIDAEESSDAVIVIDNASDVVINGIQVTGGEGDMIEESGNADRLYIGYCEIFDDLGSDGDEGIQIKYSDGVVIEYNYVHHIVQDGLNLSSATNGYVRYNEVHDIHSSNGGIYCYQDTNVSIIGNRVYNIPGNDGIKLGDDGDGTSGGSVSENVVFDCAEDGLAIYSTGCTVQGNTVTACSGENGAIHLFEACNSEVKDNLIHDNNSIGLLINESSDVLVTGNTIFNNDDSDDTKYVGSAGIWITASSTVTGVHSNGIYDNVDFGVRNDNTVVADAMGNWWGDVTGPLHSTNPGGLGNAVTDFVDFDPFMSGLASITQVASQHLISVEDNGAPFPYQTILTYSVTPVPGMPLRGLDLLVSYDPLEVEHLAPHQILLNDGAGHIAVFNYYETVPGLLNISISLVGPTAGLTASTELFSVTFDGLAEPPEVENFETPLAMEFALVRGLGNNAQPYSLGSPIDLQVDGSSPVMLPDSFFDIFPDCLDGDDKPGDVEAEDNIEMRSVQVQITPQDPLGPGFPWAPAQGPGLGPNLNGPAPGQLQWVLDFDLYPLVDGYYTLSFRPVDEVGNIGVQMDELFLLDATPPTPVTNLDADPGHGLVDLAWTASSGQDGYLVYRAQRAVYPYPAAGPTLTTAWVDGATNYSLIDTTTAPMYLDVFSGDNYATRGIYDYVVLAYDCANGTTMPVFDSSTNYYLGDMIAQSDYAGSDTYDGKVFSRDLASLGLGYGLSSGEVGFNPELDYGPSDDYSSYGIPEPDASTDFEDLIIFSMNYGLNGPELPQDNSRPSGDNTVRLVADGEHPALVLPAGLKGISVRVTSEANLIAANCEYPCFTTRHEDEWLVDVVSLNGTLPEGTRIDLVFDRAEPVEILSQDGRDFQNRHVELAVENELSGELPLAFELSQNFPNPFNPVTTIRYALPEASDVQMVLFNSLGQQVRTLVSGSKDAGWYSLQMDATGLASGVYFYRIEAGTFTDLKKMVLIK